LAAVAAANPATLITSLASERSDFYHSLPTFDHFGAGWLARLQKAKALADQLAGVQG
jgi:lysozyme family protein